MRKKTEIILNKVINTFVHNGIKCDVLEPEIEPNQQKISDIDFMAKHIWIINKDKQRQKLTLNKTQLAIENKINELKSAGIPPRIIILKARQEGVTTYFQGKMMADSSQNMDRNSLIVSHEKDSTNAIFAKSKFMYEMLDDDIKPLQRASNAREINFNTPLHYKGDGIGLNSKIVVKIAGKESIGRSDTYSYVHLSEYAFWKGVGENSPSNQMSAIMQAVPENINTIAIIESTAKGYNDFKDVWDKAVAGENGWIPLFFPWFFMDEYRKQFTSEKEKQNFIDTMDSYEKDIQVAHNLELEQLNWHRNTKKVKCNNSVDKMKQENPNTPEEAFIFSGVPVFDNDLVAQRIDVLNKKYKIKPLKQGKFTYKFYNPETRDRIVDHTIKFNQVYSNEFEGLKVENVIIYEEPLPGYPYVIGGDTKGEGKDFYTATVINNITGNRAATLRMQISSSKLYTFQLYCLGKYYNNALISIEINFNTAPIEDLQLQLLYPRLYHRRVYDSARGEYQKKYGWKTDGNTRPFIIDREIECVKESIYNFNDINTLREMLTFAEDKNGRPDAMSGKHDDLLFSDMIAEESRRQQTRTIDKSMTNDIIIDVEEEYDLEEDDYDVDNHLAD
jgi:hypothetical protein